MKIYNKFNVEELVYPTNGQTTTQIDGKWVQARPMRYSSILNRLKMCWLVLTDKCDLLEWYKQ